MSEHEFVDIRARHLAKYEGITGAFDHPVEEVTDGDQTFKIPKQTFSFWLDYVNAAIAAGWFKHLTKEMAGDFDERELFLVFRQVDDEHTRRLAQSFVDPNS